MTVTKEQALADLASIENVWELRDDNPYVRRIRQFIEQASAAPAAAEQDVRKLQEAIKDLSFPDPDGELDGWKVWDEASLRALLHDAADLVVPTLPAPVQSQAKSDSFTAVPTDEEIDELLTIKHGPFKGQPQVWFQRKEVRALLQGKGTSQDTAGVAGLAAEYRALPKNVAAGSTEGKTL